MSINKKTTILAAAILALAALIAPVFASSVTTTNPAFAKVGDVTSIPVGHSEFCKVHRRECAPNARVVEMIELDEAKWTALLNVNSGVNAKILPVTDQDLYQVAEFWTYPRGAGDCEDIALAKRRELIAAGWAASALLMAVVREPNGNGHAVLMVRTDRGDLVLDNQDGQIKLWSDTPYHFVKRQSQTDQGQWVDIVEDRNVIAVATN